MDAQRKWLAQQMESIPLTPLTSHGSCGRVMVRSSVTSQMVGRSPDALDEGAVRTPPRPVRLT